MKTCSKCKESKPLEMFYADRRRKDGRQAECTVCRSVRLATYYAANKERRWAYVAAYRVRPAVKECESARKAAWYAENRDWKDWLDSQSRMLRGGR